MTNHSNSIAVEDQTCGYLTDVEGNLDYLDRYVERSEVLDWNASKSALVLRDGCAFVYGGDSQDKGVGDIRVAWLLVDLKKRYPERVALLIGNRDANKLRLAAELSEAAIANDAVRTDQEFPYWVAKDKRVTPAAYLKQTGQPDNAASRLKWMLKDTMGADGAFERRRLELAELKGGAAENASEVTDEEVVRSYRREVDPTAPEEERFMLEYLRVGQLAFKWGSTLFVHGGVSDANVGTVPGCEGREEDAEAWVRRLNEWAGLQVAAYEQRYAADVAAGTVSQLRGGHGLMDYGVPGGNEGATVVVSSHLDNGNAAPLSLRVREFLAANRIASVVVGHTPHGNCPTVIRSGESMVIAADTSYSKMGHQSRWGVDNRGEAVSEVLVTRSGAATVHGVLPDGRSLRYSLDPDSTRRGDPFVGRQLADGRWVKALVEGEEGEEGSYMLCLGQGFKLSLEEVTKSELEQVEWARVEPLSLPQDVREQHGGDCSPSATRASRGATREGRGSTRERRGSARHRGSGRGHSWPALVAAVRSLH